MLRLIDHNKINALYFIEINSRENLRLNNPKISILISGLYILGKEYYNLIEYQEYYF